MQHVDLSTFRQGDDVLAGTDWMLVVKSQDQLARRRRMLESRANGRIGRIKPRPTATGLLVQGVLQNGRFDVAASKEFREPRHVRKLSDRSYLFTEINQLLAIDESGAVQKTFTHPYFAFLHTVDCTPDRRRALVVSSGFDAIFEIDLETGDETFRWFAWDHGFNPDEDGCWLAADPEVLKRYQAEGKNAVFIDPADYGEQGLVTARRSAHPNGAVYDPHDDYRSLVFSIGHYGELWRADLSTGRTTKVGDFLNQMPHGLFPHADGWFVTNTTRGEWWHLDRELQPQICYSLAGLADKVPGTEDVEWIQQVIPIGDHHALFLDANRGLVAVDFESERYSIYQADPNWCIQDALFCEAADRAELRSVA